MGKASHIFIDNMEKYKDPVRYDKEYEQHQAEIPLLLEWAKKQGGPVIDLACGTGRATIPLARSGISMIGIDLNEGMLERAKQKANEQHISILWSLQDCSAFSIGCKSPFIYMIGNSFQHFLTNESQSTLLRSVYQHLSDNGIFLFGVRFPTVNELQSGTIHKKVCHDAEGRQVTEYNQKEYDALTQVVLSTTIKVTKEHTGVESVEKESISLRYVFPLELDRIVKESGFSVLAKYGCWNKSPLATNSKEMIYLCQK
ncbi:class I SAM-dependent methyltransferase [Alkalihalobacillus sp. LMS39]|uniref:class I SAM-dependent DNA methyltransferase n=1 Tax=Alkalihalobacillus sp. LMS39 TaxID=2924032 RepID=UPI001FB35B5D|nr:class I SAM-dependent methyltransferase [Alkalihalobacillus sp. LMS39]UOE92475.1 class I SAM-dependent methyltransferase [Alkalihalobacillus sp. LMS39]